jgi:nucleotidyltransferase substrate binding protein (TIGR01987 family)
VDRDIRWKQRFQNFDRAVELLHEPFEKGLMNLSLLEKEGVVQRFEVAVELAWKTMKDYLEEEGVKINPITPRNIIKEAFAARIIEDGQVWLAMLDHRNLLSHTYDRQAFEKAVDLLEKRYLSVIDQLHNWFQQQLNPS